MTELEYGLYPERVPGAGRVPGARPVTGAWQRSGSGRRLTAVSSLVSCSLSKLMISASPRIATLLPLRSWWVAPSGRSPEDGTPNQANTVL
jgi:hypothetical protein